MAIDFIVIDRSQQHGNKCVSAAGKIQEVQDEIENLEANAQRMWDTGDHVLLEQQFGLATGAGANFLSLLGSVKTALNVAILEEYVARVANQ